MNARYPVLGVLYGVTPVLGVLYSVTPVPCTVRSLWCNTSAGNTIENAQYRVLVLHYRERPALVLHHRERPVQGTGVTQ